MSGLSACRSGVYDLGDRQDDFEAGRRGRDPHVTRSVRVRGEFSPRPAGARRGAIDAATYASLRLLSGRRGSGPLRIAAAVRRELAVGGDAVRHAVFAFAYKTLSAGTGALVLAAVHHDDFRGLLGGASGTGPVAGLALAFFGLGYLVRPGLAAPSPVGAGLMAVAGIAWGVYSLRGRRAGKPLAETAGNFARASLLAVIVSGAGSGALVGRLRAARPDAELTEVACEERPQLAARLRLGPPRCARRPR
jgi:hypothetical protein